MKILVVRFSSIGDIVLTSPVVRCVSQQLGAEVHFLTKKNFVGILEHNPYIRKTWSLEQASWNELTKQLSAEKFDYVIDLHNNLRTFRLKWALGVKSYSFNKLNFGKWILVRFKRNILPPIHIVERYMETVKPIGVTNDQAGLDFFIPKEIRAQALPDGLMAGNFVALVVGAAHATKRIPKEKLVEYCLASPYPIALLGGPKDAILAGEVKSTIQESHPFKTILNTCGKHSLLGSAAIMEQSMAVVTPDTGLMHIAAALHKPVLSVWGSTVPAFGMTPYYPKREERFTILENNNIDCRPCSKIGFERCPKGHFACMKTLDLGACANLDWVNS